MPDPLPVMSRSPGGGRTVLACALAALVIVAHAGLIGRSRWQADEYQHFALLRDEGLSFALNRFLGWGPRPWSELLGTAYGLAVNRLHRPLAGSCMALLWAGLGMACLLPAWFGAAGRGDDAARWPRLLLGLAIFAFFLLGHPVTEVFFWPAGGLAYVPTLAAAAWLFWCLADGVATRLRARSAAAALALAAGSSEVGLFLTVLFSGFVVLRPCGLRRRQLWWLVPGVAVSVPLVVLLLHGRVGNEQLHGQVGRAALAGMAGPPANAGPFLHHPGASLVQAVPDFVREAAGLGDGGMDAPPGPAILAGVAGFLGGRWIFLGRRRRESGLFLPHLACALLVAAFCSVAAAYYQFGRVCCQRHETMRGCYLVLAAVSFGAASVRWRPPARTVPGLAAAALLLPVSLMYAARMPALIEAYRAYPQAVQARAATWRSGLQPGTGDMTLVLEPDGSLISSGEFLAPGDEVLSPESPWYLAGLLQFFEKRRVHVQAAPR